jgi:16S rRNA C1402 (ribose-2'-O) methylase RsmI
MAVDSRVGLHRAYEAREKNELAFYEADARRRAVLEQVRAVTPLGRIDLASAADLSSVIEQLHEQLLDEARSTARFGARVHDMHALIERWRQYRVPGGEAP